MGAASARAYDGATAADLVRTLGVPRAVVLESVPSTMDVAHELARSGAPAGTLVVAEEQTAGRGRQGKRWASAPGSGIWLTLLERPADRRATEVLSLRVGLAAAHALRPFASGRISLKWPNDLYLSDGKLAGILIEARWTGPVLDYVLIGFGVNVRSADGLPPDVGALDRVDSRAKVLVPLVVALREAASLTGPLAPPELATFHEVALGLGRRCTQPAPGVVEGVSPAGDLLVRADDGRLTAHRAGSLAFEDAP